MRGVKRAHGHRADRHSDRDGHAELAIAIAVAQFDAEFDAQRIRPSAESHGHGRRELGSGRGEHALRQPTAMRLGPEFEGRLRLRGRDPRWATVHADHDRAAGSAGSCFARRSLGTSALRTGHRAHGAVCSALPVQAGSQAVPHAQAHVRQHGIRGHPRPTGVPLRPGPHGQWQGIPPHLGQPWAYRSTASVRSTPTWLASEATQASTSPNSCSRS